MNSTTNTSENKNKEFYDWITLQPFAIDVYTLFLALYLSNDWIFKSIRKDIFS